VQQVAATGKLPLELGGNIHLFRQRWWKSTFIPALLTPPASGSSLQPAHVKLGELLVDRGMLAAQQASSCSARVAIHSLTALQWDDFLVRVRLLAQDRQLPPPAGTSAAAPHVSASAAAARAGSSAACPLSQLACSHAQPHQLQVTIDDA
jgi:hypothetical protein